MTSGVVRRILAPMRLTDTTQVRKLSNGCVAVYEPGKVAVIIQRDAENLWDCSWELQDGITEDGEAYIRQCGTACVGLDNGFACENGHRHFDYGTFEYFDEDEIGAARDGLRSLPSNARSMAGMAL